MFSIFETLNPLKVIESSYKDVYKQVRIFKSLYIYRIFLENSFEYFYLHGEYKNQIEECI